jgi:hypothetical protein
MNYALTKEAIDAVNQWAQPIASTARQIMDRIEREQRLPKGAIMSKCRQRHITKARYDAISELYKYGNSCGRKLTRARIAVIFDVKFPTVDYALRKRGLIR